MRRSLQRQWKRSLAGLALLIALGQVPALAATLNVGGTCTLVRAINAANNNTTASGNCRKGSGADTIVLPNGSTQRLTRVNNTVFGPTGLPVIRSDIIIAGNNSTIRRAGTAPRFRIFAVGDTGDLTLRRTTVSGGRAPGDNLGGGVYIYGYGGSVSLTNSTISGNSAFVGGGVANEYEGRGDLTVTNSSISNNASSGIFFFAGSVSLTNSTISGNAGSGVVGTGTNVTVIDSTISGNKGGAGLNGFEYTTFTVNRSTISGNQGTGMNLNLDSSATLTNSTISGNGRYGVNVGYSDVSLINTTVTGNRGGGVDSYSGTATLTRTVIAGNTGRPGGAEVFNDNGSITAASFNLFGYRGLTNGQAFENFTPGPTDITATSNGNDPTALVNILNTNLANNGGPTRTHALVGGSPAMDAVTADTCPPPNRD